MVDQNRIEFEAAATIDEQSFAKAEKRAEQLLKTNQDVNRAAAGGGGGRREVVGDEEFSRVSQDVALAGDVESNLRAVGGALGAVGGEAGRAAEGLISVAAEFPAVVEAGPRLVTSLKGFPAAMKASATAMLGLETASAAASATSTAAATAETAQTAAATALAPASVAAAGGMSAMLLPLAPFIAAAAAAAAAVGAMAFAIHAATKASNEHADAIDEQRQANNTYIESLSMTTEEIQAQIDANNQALGEIDLKKTFEEEVINAEKSRGVIESIHGQIGDALGITGAAGDQASESLENLGDEATELIATNESLAESMNSVEAAANDAREALLDEVDQIGELRKFEQEALSASAEQNAERAQAIANEKAIIEEQIATLEARGDESKEVQDKIKELSGEMETLNQQSEILSSSAVKASEAEKEAAAAAEELATAADGLGKDLEAASKKSASARESEVKAQNELSKVAAEAGRESAKLRKEQNEELLELDTEQGEELIKQQTKAHEDALKAQDDFDKSIRDKVKNQSFLAALDEQDDFVEGQAEDKQEQAKKIADLREGFAEERIERLTAQAEQRADAAESAAEQIASSQEALNEASKVRADAKREEQALIRDSERDKVELIRNRVQAETQLYQTVLTNFGQFASQMRQQANQLLSGSQSGNVNGSNALGGITTKQLQGIIG